MALIVDSPFLAFILFEHTANFTFAEGVHVMRGELHTLVPTCVFRTVKERQLSKLWCNSIPLNIHTLRLHIKSFA